MDGDVTGVMSQRDVPGKLPKTSLTGSLSESGLYGLIERIQVKLNLNGNAIPLGPFPNLVITNTLIGLVATLKGVEGKVTNIDIKMQTV